jgi:hypothetical protein
MRALSTTPMRTRQLACSWSAAGLRAAARQVQVDLSPQAVEQVAARVAILLRRGGSAEQAQLLSAGELAHRLRVERPWVYRHRHLLGGIRIGVGPKAPWRFDYEKAVEALRGRQADQRHTEDH